MRNPAHTKKADERRIVLALARGPMTFHAVSPSSLQLSSGERLLKVCASAVSRLAGRGLIVRQKDQVVLTRDGVSHAKRLLAAAEPFREQHQDLEAATVDGPDGLIAVTVNLAESPLALLARRKDRDGVAFLTAAEFGAGERLRADYTRGQIMPRLGANWEAPISTGRRGAPAAELTDGALAARQRVERAIDAVGPELSGVLIDVCCFLKGLEQVETERGWPVRSAKLILKSALGSLARHYDPGSHRRRGSILSWGAPDARPSISQ